MKHYTFFLVAVATTTGLVGLSAPAPGQSSGESAPAFVTEILHGYRTGDGSPRPMKQAPSSTGAVLGNDVVFHRLTGKGKSPVSGSAR